MKFWKWFRIFGVIGVIALCAAIYYFKGQAGEQTTDGPPAATPADQAPNTPSYYR